MLHPINKTFKPQNTQRQAVSYPIFPADEKRMHQMYTSKLQPKEPTVLADLKKAIV